MLARCATTERGQTTFQRKWRPNPVGERSSCERTTSGGNNATDKSVDKLTLQSPRPHGTVTTEVTKKPFPGGRAGHHNAVYNTYRCNGG